METNTNPAPTWIVTGPLARTGRSYTSVKAARRAVDRLDAQYGASSHSYRRVDLGA